MFSTDMFATGRCRYPSKFCPNARARKRNGELHRFCEEHRAKANDNQKRWSSTRQRQWDAMEYQAAAAAASQRAIGVDPRVFPTASQAHYNPHVREEAHVGAAPIYSELVPGPVSEAQRAPLVQSATTTTQSPHVITRTPSQVDRYLTHLLFRSQSSVDWEEPESCTHVSQTSA